MLKQYCEKKCRLGNTSTTCNQGDVSNLNFGLINEDLVPRNRTFF